MEGGGTSPYDAAKAGGYTGTEEEFNAILAMIPDEEKQNAWDGKADASDISDHAGDTNIHVTVDEKSAWNNKASEEELAVVQADAQSALEAAEAAQAAVDSEAAAREAAISSEVSARQSAIAALQTGLAQCGNCQIQVGSYTGKGTYGSSNPVSLTFSAKPLALIVMNASGNEDMMFALRPCDRGKVNAVIVNWSDTGVSWYGTGSASQQMNYGYTYYYVAFLETE